MSSLNICFENKYFHERSKLYYKNINDSLNIFNIIIVGVVSISNNITALYEAKTNIILIIYSIILYITTILSSVQYFMKYEYLIEQHNTAAIRYNYLYNLILEGNTTNVLISRELENLYSTTPNIPDFILKNKPILESKIIKIPDDDIDIALDYQLNKFSNSNF